MIKLPNLTRFQNQIFEMKNMELSEFFDFLFYIWFIFACLIVFLILTAKQQDHG